MIRIREFLRNDIGQVAELHREVMQTAPAMTPSLADRYREWLSAVFLDSPMRRDGLGSLVADDDGTIVGFIGAVAREVTLRGQVYRGTAASNFCVRPDRRGRLGIQMAREHLSRSADLAIIDELTDRTRGVWDRLGMVQMPQSVRWTLPLRPLGHALSLADGHLPRWLASVARPVASLVDAASARIPRSPFRYASSALVAGTLTADTLEELLAGFGGDEYLRPVASDGSAAWLLSRARVMRTFGDLQAVVLRHPQGQVAGWYVYYARHGPSHVLQLVSGTTMAHEVLSHLATHARARGVVSLTGTLDSAFLSALSEHWAVISPSPMVTRWRLVYSRQPEILEAFWRDRVLLSRLDGEWCQQFA